MGAYDSGGHKNARFLESRQVGPFPEAYGKAWTHIGQEAMEIYELREGSCQKEWRKMWPLKYPTLANVKNRGAADIRRAGSNWEEHQAEQDGQETQMGTWAASAREGPEGREVDAWSDENEEEEMDEIREAVAEAIHDAEAQAVTQDTSQQAAESTSIMESSTPTTTQAAQDHPSITTTPAPASQERGEPRTGRTPLHRLHDALRRRFGNEIMRNSEANAETVRGSKNMQRQKETT